MNKKTSILIAILVSLMMVVPLAYGAVASTSISDNEVVFVPDSQGGISVDESVNNLVVGPTTQDNRPAFRIQTNASDENLVPPFRYNKNFSIEIPAGVSFCLKIEAGKGWIGLDSSIRMDLEVGNEVYNAVTETGIRYYSPGNVKADGVSMTPVRNFNDIVFYTSEETVKINGVATKPLFSTNLKMYVLYDN